MNYYNNYSQQEYFDTNNSYGYEGDFYQDASQPLNGNQSSVNENNGVRQPARSKHSYSQIRSRNRQRGDTLSQGGSKSTDETSKDAHQTDKSKAEIDDSRTVGSSKDRGKKQGGRFYGSDSRTRTFENRNRRQDNDMRSRDKDSNVNDSKDVENDDNQTESQNKSENKEGMGAKPKGYRQHYSFDERGRNERGRFDRYGKRSLPEKHRFNSRRNDTNDKQQRQNYGENVNNNSNTEDSERRYNSQISDADKLDDRIDHGGGDDFSKKDNKDDDDGTAFDYRNESVRIQKSQQGRYQRRTTRNRVLRKVDESQRGVLIDQLTRGTYECMVCCETVRAQNAIWSCCNCYHVFHLRCIKQWARSPTAIVAGSEKNGWRCPACQNLTFKFPNQYRCFCGKVRDPDFNRLETPHSCGNVCQKDRGEDCKHPCIVLCHPGPCPECTAVVNKSCDCGKTKQLVKCGQSSAIKCTSTCDRQLNCGKHFCKAVCHAGSCEKCEETVQQDCYGGHEKREVACGSSEDFAQSYSCGKICSKVLDCSNHTCETKCHPGPCVSCPDLPANVTHCPCGAKPLSELSQDPRTSCLDPVPTCDNICNKELACGPEGNHHRCKQVCHTGPCGSCDGETEVTCRCGAMEKQFKCSELPQFTEENGMYLCDKRCNKRKSCGRHKCGQNCCVKTEHPCEMICGRKLSCGLHQCEEPCHKGNCPPCLMASFEELTCTCGAEVLFPPIPCGTSPPECHQPCSREHPCKHPVRHNCHSEEKCPPCTELTKKACMGSHEIRANIPCNLQDISCGMPCRKPLPCGEHTCQRICHKGRCLEEGETCTQPCQRKREACEHICGAPCHGEEHCPNTPCKAQVTVKCPCGHREKKTVCSLGGQQDVADYQKITIQNLADSIQGMMGVSSVNLNKFNKIGGGRILECDEGCALLERNKRFALALEIQNPDLSAKLGNPSYSDFLKDYAKQFPQFVAGIEKSLSELVQSAKQSKQPSRSHSFPVMNSNQRRCIHELAEHYGCETQSYDYEPKKNVVATAPRDRCWLPSVTLTALVQRELHPRAPPPIPHVHKEEVLRQNNMAAKQSTSLLSDTSDPPPNAWHTVGKKSKSAKTTTTSRLEKFDLGSVGKLDYTKLSTETKDALKSEPVVDYFDFTFT